MIATMTNIYWELLFQASGGKQLSKMIFNDSSLLIFMLLCNPFLWLWVEFNNLLLMIRMQEMWLAATSEIKLQREHDFHDFHCVHTLLVAVSYKTSCHVVSFCMEKPMWQRTKGRLQPTASIELRSSVQLSQRNWILLTTTWVNLTADASSVKPWL